MSPWSVSSAGGPCPTFAPVIPIVGGEFAYSVDDQAPALVCDELPIPVTDGNALPSNFTIGATLPELARQFVGIGPIGSDDVDFVLALDEQRPIYLSDTAQPFLLIQEVMEEP